MTSNLQWDSHIALISSKAYKKLGLLRRSFSSAVHINAKHGLCLSLIRSQLVYCSQIWRPYLLTDIILLERVQRRATKFILNDYSSNYKSRLIALRLLPLMMVYELYDISFFIKCLKHPTASFNIMNYIKFSAGSTRSGSFHKLVHPSVKTNKSKHFYFTRLPRLWNSLSPIDLNQSHNSIMNSIKTHFWDYFMDNFDDNITCTFHFCCPCHTCSSSTRMNFNPNS